MNVVGLTGGIGSGKSIVAQVFSQLGICVYDSDQRAKELYFKDFIRKRVIELLGELSFKEANPDFAFISSKVFSDPLLLNELNAIIHPAVKEDFKLWLDEKAHQGESWVLKESALLIETKAYEKCHSVILVSSPEEIRIERVMLRNSFSKEEVKRRIQNQIGDDARMPHAEFCINNDGQTALIPQIVNIYKILNSRFGNSHS